MGTSTKYPGPRGGRWKTANQRLGSWVSSIDRSVRAAADTGGGLVSAGTLIQGTDEKAQELANEYRAALAAAVCQDPSAFGLRDRLLASGSRLVDTLEALRAGTADWFPLEAGSPEARQAGFVRAFTQRVAGSGGLVADAAVRKAAVSCAQELLSGSAQLQQAIRSGTHIRSRVLRRTVLPDLPALLQEVTGRIHRDHCRGEGQACVPAIACDRPRGKDRRLGRTAGRRAHSGPVRGGSPARRRAVFGGPG